MRFRFFTLILFCFSFVSFALGQDNWIGIQQGVAVKAYAGKSFRYTVSAKTDGAPEVLAMMGAQVNRANGEWGYFNNGAEQPFVDTLWNTRTIEGTLDSDAVTLNLGL